MERDRWDLGPKEGRFRMRRSGLGKNKQSHSSHHSAHPLHQGTDVAGNLVSAQSKEVLYELEWSRYEMNTVVEGGVEARFQPFEIIRKEVEYHRAGLKFCWRWQPGWIALLCLSWKRWPGARLGKGEEKESWCRGVIRALGKKWERRRHMWLP